MLQLLDGGTEIGFIGPTVVPDMELKQVNRVDAELLADQVGVLEHVFRGEHIFVFIFWQCRPLQISRRNFRRGIEALLRVAIQDLAEQAVALAVAVRPCCIEEIAAEIDGQLQGRERFRVVRTSPAAHAPKSVGDVAHFKTGTAQLAVFHEMYPSL